MSILIKGTKMPKNCEECQSTLGLFADECPLFAEFPKKFDFDPEIYHNRRYDGCPLVEIPPHGRLIDADKLLERIKRDFDTKCIFNNEEEAYQSAIEDIEFIIDCASTVIESEEQEHE